MAACPAVTVAEADPPLGVVREKSVPEPKREIAWGLPPALSVTANVAVRLVAADGVKAMLMVHATPGCTEAPQLSDSVKSVGFVPAIFRLEIDKVTFPELSRAML